jgi:protein-S-isoprenylcysteine O-methyltransferase Ste14
MGKYSIKRGVFRKDLLWFGLPAIVVLFVGLVVSAMDGYVGLTRILLDIGRDPGNLRLLSAWNIAGVLLFILGLSIVLAAHITLKHFYSSFLVVRKDHQLIRHGIYRFTRHPVYLGSLMCCLGPPVSAPSLYGFLVMLVLVPIVLNRIRMEEDMLIEEFGEAYLAYRKSTSKLIPFIY